jgi:hypothetical protein
VKRKHFVNEERISKEKLIRHISEVYNTVHLYSHLIFLLREWVHQQQELRG